MNPSKACAPRKMYRRAHTRTALAIAPPPKKRLDSEWWTPRSGLLRFLTETLNDSIFFVVNFPKLHHHQVLFFSIRHLLLWLRFFLSTPLKVRHHTLDAKAQNTCLRFNHPRAARLCARFPSEIRRTPRRRPQKTRRRLARLRPTSPERASATRRE